MTTPGLLRILEESQELLNRATDAENRKRMRILHSNLEEELRRCAKAAEEGYREASEHLREICAVIGQAAEGAEAVQETATGQGRREEDNSIHQQLLKSVESMTETHRTSLAEIRTNRERLATFNITLFGRTMAGKSTLMEILTRGDGRSIGKGGQRTTQDAREYEWNGMKVLDIPGVAAMDGALDEETAYGAAHQADLILFLITDDAPQQVEAEHLARLRQIGVPILGICNVKRAVDDERHIRLFIRDQERVFGLARLDGLISQFHEMTDRHGAGQRVEFKPAHLLSRFLAGQPEHGHWQVELETASRFTDIEDHICDEVSQNGRFHRQRSFLESASRASFNAWERMLEAGETTYKLHDRIGDHARETRTWRKQFRRSCNTRLQQAIDDTIGVLRSDIPDFAEENCENAWLGRLWEEKIKSAGIEGGLQDLQRELQQQVDEKVKTLIDEIGQELELLSHDFESPHIQVGNIRNYRRYWDWGTLGTASILNVAAMAVTPTPLAPLAGPLRVAAGALGVINRIFRGVFGDKDKRRREAIDGITTVLYRCLSEGESSIRQKFQQWLDETLIGQQVNRTIKQLEEAAISTDEAAKFYQAQAQALNYRQMRLNLKILQEALERVNGWVELPTGASVARVPGQVMVIKGGNTLYKMTIRQLELLLQERVETIPARRSRKQLIEWCTRGKSGQGDITIDDLRATARATYDGEDQETLVMVSIGRQLTGLNIINET